jgi:NADPH-dependent ferric siderophore reductase
LFEIKGERIAKLTDDLPRVMEERFVKQATAQMAASGGRPVVWIFAEEKAALFAREVFDRTDGLKGITIAYVPWTR